MAGARMEIDEAAFKVITEKLRDLSDKDIKKVNRNALKAAARKGVSAARRQLVSDTPGFRGREHYHGQQYTKGIGVWKKSNDKQSGVAMRRGDFYPLLFFEAGTAERVTSKGARRGRIEARHSMRNALMATSPAMGKEIDYRIAVEIMKIWNRKNRQK